MLVKIRKQLKDRQQAISAGSDKVPVALKHLPQLHAGSSMHPVCLPVTQADNTDAPLVLEQGMLVARSLLDTICQKLRASLPLPDF